MKRDTSTLASKTYDLVVIGGGAYGCCAAWEASSRGLSVALVDMDDFCHATSANHLKMVHGGIRYLQHLDIPRVRESLRERAVLLRIAPHLVNPIPIVMPTYGKGLDGRIVLGAGLKLYDAIAIDRNRGIEDPARQIPAGRLLTRSEVLEMYPDLDRKGLTGAGLFYDGHFYNPQRLALAFLMAAVNAGANVANYVEVKSFLRERDRISGVIVTDKLSGDRFDIRAKSVLNTAGPWAPGLLGHVLEATPNPTFSRDAGLVLRRSLAGDCALACQVGTSDPDAILSRRGRHVFLVPWRGYTLLGVWHKVHSGPTDSIGVAEAEIQDWLTEVNDAYPAFGLELADVSTVYSGLILFGDNQTDTKNLRFGKRSLLIDHEAEHNVPGLWTLIGVRATTARGMAEKAISRIISRINIGGPSQSKEIILPGGDIPDFEGFLEDTRKACAPKFPERIADSLARNYGTCTDNILRLAEIESELAEPLDDTHILKAEIVHACRNEMALKLQDVVFRRTELGTAENPGEDALRASAELMGRELGWSPQRIKLEIEQTIEQFPR